MRRTLLPFLFVLYALSALAAERPAFLLRVERLSDFSREELLTSRYDVAAEMVSCLLVRGGEAEVAKLEAAGYGTTILDSDPLGWDYYQVGLRPDSDKDALAAVGTVIHTEDNWVLLRVVPGTRLDRLFEAKVFVGPIGRDPLKQPVHPNEISSRHLQRNLSAVPLVQQMVNSVVNTDIMNYWTTLTTNSPTGTRYSTSTGCTNAATYVYNTYTGLGIPSTYQTWNASHAPNTIGTMTGALNPTKVYILINHLDDLPASGLAPGADDNGSGSVTNLELAKIMSCYAFRNTVKLIACTGEEAGLLGSEAYAADAQARGENIQGVISFDMPGWAGDGLPATGENLDLNYNTGVPGSQALGELFAACAADYGTGLPVDAFNCPALDASDHYPFWTRGWAAICAITDNEGYCSHAGNYPYYHTVNDTIANCGSPSFFYSAVRATLATLAELGDPFKITLDRDSYGCTVPVTVIVGDRDLNTNASTIETTTIPIRSTRESTPESLVLTEQGVNSMIFKGTINLTGAAPVHGDGLLSVSTGDTLVADYVDALDCNGAANVAYSATGSVSTDCAPPVISNVLATAITGSSAVITWTTNEAANSRVTYGMSTPPGTNKDDPATYVTSHSVQLTGLTTCSPYYFSVASADVVGNTAADNNGGSYYTFTTVASNQTVYSENFTGVTAPALPAGWTISSTSGNSWVTNASGCTGNALMYPYNSSSAANSWAYTPGQTLTTGVTYTVTVNQKVYNGTYPEIFEIKCGSAATPAGQTITVLASASYTNTTCQQLTGTFTVPSNGTYYLGFHCTSVANMWNLYIDDVVLARPGSCTADVAYVSNAFADACGAGGTGNANGYIDAGETVTVHPTLTNNGSLTATGVSATLSTATAGITVTGATATYPDILPAGTQACNAPHFTFTVGSGVTCGTVIDFNLHITAAVGGPWDRTFTMTVGNVVVGGPVTDFSQNFTGVTPPAFPTGWTTLNAGSGNNWQTTNSYYCGAAPGMYYPYNSSNAANAWAFTPGIALTAGVTYTLGFSQKVQSASFPETFEVKCGTAATVAGQTITVLASATYTNTTCTTRTPTFTVPTTGTYYLGFHCTSAKDEYYLIIDDIALTHQSTPSCTMTACAAVPGETAPGDLLSTAQTWSDKTTHTWPANAQATGYKLVLGTAAQLPNLLNSSTDSCQKWTGTGTSCTLSDTPAAGSFYWFLVIGTNGVGDGSAGNATAGARVLNYTTGTCP